MIEMGSFEAKTHFAEILRRVESGEDFCITRRGKRVAVITSPDASRRKQALSAFRQLQNLKDRHPLGLPGDIAAWKEEGRR